MMMKTRAAHNRGACGSRKARAREGRHTPPSPPPLFLSLSLPLSPLTRRRGVPTYARLKAKALPSRKTPARGSLSTGVRCRQWREGGRERRVCVCVEGGGHNSHAFIVSYPVPDHLVCLYVFSFFIFKIQCTFIFLYTPRPPSFLPNLLSPSPSLRGLPSSLSLLITPFLLLQRHILTFKGKFQTPFVLLSSQVRRTRSKSLHFTASWRVIGGIWALDLLQGKL